MSINLKNIYIKGGHTAIDILENIDLLIDGAEFIDNQKGLVVRKSSKVLAKIKWWEKSKISISLTILGLIIAFISIPWWSIFFSYFLRK